MATISTNPSLAQGYQYNVSTSWGAGPKTQPILGLPLILGIHDVGLYGTETVGIGADANTGLTLQGEHVVGVNASSFYIGSLGLGMGPDNSSLLGALFNQKMTPSFSYGYTAGALYREYLSLHLQANRLTLIQSNPPFSAVSLWEATILHVSTLGQTLPLRYKPTIAV